MFRVNSLLVIALAIILFVQPAFSQSAGAKIPILFDCDIGEDIDDTFALATVIASPELELRGVTTVGEDAHKRAQMVSRFLTAVGHGKKDFVAAGLPEKTTRPLAYWQVQYGNHASVYFRDAKPAKERAPAFLYKHLKANPGDLTIVAVGPLTNIAKVLTDHPDAKPMIKRIVLMGGSVYRGYNDGSKPQAEYNIAADAKAAQTVFRSGIPLVVAPLDATAMVKLDAARQKKLFERGSLLTLSVQALVQLWKDKNDPILYDAVAVTLTHTEKFCKMEDLAIDVDDKGFTKVVKDQKPNARVATSIKTDEYLDWLVDRLINAQPPSWPTMRVVNKSEMVPRGKMPNRVHVFEDFETDIEKRWWLAGRLTSTRVIMELKLAQCKINQVDPRTVFDVLQVFFGSQKLSDFKSFVQSGAAIALDGAAEDAQSLQQLKVRNANGVMIPLPDLVAIRAFGNAPAKMPPGSLRALRGVLTQDFDDRQGETKTLYTAVVFNPVPGPPMGKRTQLSFRYFLKGTDTLRVQLYSLTNGYHRCLMLTGLPQGKWMDGNVDMTQMRKPDGAGGPLSENERIDDIQFYADPRAELLIDDIVLYDAADEKEARPFPKRFLFTGWFDSGKQGKEWPGSFEIDQKKGVFWHAAKSVPAADGKTARLEVGFRGERPIGDAVRLSFAYKTEGTEYFTLRLQPSKTETEMRAAAGWNRVDLNLNPTKQYRQGDTVKGIVFTLPATGTLWIDDLLLYEPADTAKK